MAANSSDRLRDPNPYEVIKVSINASNAEITKAFTVAMKAREYPADVIARARKRLLDSQERSLARYLCIDFPEIKQPEIKQPEIKQSEIKQSEIDDPPKPEPEHREDLEGDHEVETMEVSLADLDELSDLLAVDEDGALGLDQLLGRHFFKISF